MTSRQSLCSAMEFQTFHSLTRCIENYRQKAKTAVRESRLGEKKEKGKEKKLEGQIRIDLAGLLSHI